MRHIIVEANSELEAKIKAEKELKDGEALHDLYKIRANRWHVEIGKDLEELSR